MPEAAEDVKLVILEPVHRRKSVSLIREASIGKSAMEQIIKFRTPGLTEKDA